MKLPKPFLVAFLATAILLLACAWFPRLPEIGVMIGMMAFFLGGFAALAIQVGMEFARPRQLKIASFVFVGFILSIAALGWTFNIFPYIWNGAAVLLLSLAVLVLGACVAWQCGCDYLGAFREPKAPASPLDWTALEKGLIPRTSDEKIDRQKDHFSHSYEVHGFCIPRTSHYGLIGRPLRMDE
jgi:hypothetical protein